MSTSHPHAHPTSSPTLSTTSSSASTTATVIDSHPNPKSLVNLGKQLKYLSIGLVVSSYFQVYSHLADALSLGIASSASAKLALISVVLLVGTVVMFTYVMLLPARGYTINYVDWRRDAHLTTAIPLLTACIIFGWLSLLITLSPIGAPAPPAIGIRQRLEQAASSTGFKGLSERINAIPTSLFPSSGKEGGWDKFASTLALNKGSAGVFKEYFIKVTERAEEWGRANLRAMGWTGAIAGSVATYIGVFGAVGLVGFVAPDNRADKQKRF